ncbi:MAG: NupC/NupG family nucleoside CNT transporter [Magnetovibrionaceae bacterium]
MALQLQSLIGILALVLIAWAFSENRSLASPKRAWRMIAVALGLQLALALILLKVPVFRAFFIALNDVVLTLQAATRAGSSFVFGYLGGGNLPFEESFPGAAFVLAFQALPIILVISALSALLFHWRVLPMVVRGFAFLLERSLKVGGAVGVSAAANVFVGMVEAPVLVRPYVARLSRSELFMMMTCGMATIAGTVIVLYATFVSAVLPDAMGHILTASILSAPAAILIARLMVPDEAAPTPGELGPAPEIRGAMHAITVGTAAGIQLLISVTAMLLVLVALVSLVNAILGLLPDIAGGALTLERAFGWVFSPLVWAIGLPWAEATTGGSLMGVKTVLNEFLAYLQMSQLPEGTLSDRSNLIMTYALCGFANFGSLGIMIAGLIAIAPERRETIVELGMKSMLSGTLATLMTGAMVGLITSP